jgi:hypothetical protein
MFPGTGCVLDGSHMNSIDFTLAVIDLAVDAGFEIDQEQYRKDIDWMNSEVDDEDIYLDILNALDWTYEDALEFLNSGLPDGLHYTVDCNCLILEELDD